MNKINLINKNNSFINILKKGTSYSKKNLKIFNHKYINFDKHGLSKTLVCLSALALTSLHACNNEEIKPEENISIEDIHSKNLLLKMLDESMNTLGLIVKPSKSLTEVKTISFDSDKTKYYIQPYKITDKETILNIAKINADNTPEKKSIFIFFILHYKYIKSNYFFIVKVRSG